MAGGGRGRGRGEWKPVTSSSSSSRGRKPKGSRELGHERSLDSQNQGSCSSYPSVSSKKSQMPMPVQPPESLESPPQMVTTVQPPKSIDSQLQIATPVQAPKSQDSLVLRPQESLCSALLAMGNSPDERRNGTARAPYFSASSTLPMAGTGRGEWKPATAYSQQQKSWGSREFGSERSLESQKEGLCSFSPSVSSKKSQMVTPIQPTPKSLDSPLQTVKQVQPPKSLDSPLQKVTPVQAPESQESLVQMFSSIQLSKPPESKSTLSVSGAVGSDSGADPFDICMGNSKGSFKLNRSLHEINKEKRLREKELSNSPAHLQHLRPGMVLLKHFLKPNDQVKIIKLCRDLGVGTGGFYQPGYREGAKLSLRMMCLGKNWDPDSRSYGDVRPYDGAQPPQIPQELTKFVEDAIKASHEFLKQKMPLLPDICIVNFYTSSGKLGLHQDKDESIDSIAKRLPVVSFSLGETAEFLYGEDRDDDKASKVDLESGDVLIFGGPSRLMYHGVSKIKPKTAPSWVTDEAKLRAGRLNLTFRKY